MHLCVSVSPRRRVFLRLRILQLKGGLAYHRNIHSDRFGNGLDWHQQGRF
ncbi:hypothetical protein [Nostoc sp. 106C]|nr:hypothetical protein [Nostoc sp. 106C]